MTRRRALLGPRLHRTFVTLLPPAECADRLAALVDQARGPYTALRSFFRVGPPETVWQEEDDEFAFTLGTRDATGGPDDGPFSARGRLRALDGRTLIEIRLSHLFDRSGLLHLIWPVVGLTFILADLLGWLPDGGRLAYMAEFFRTFLFVVLPLGLVMFSVYFVGENRRDAVGQRIFTLLEATEVPMGADPERVLADRAPRVIASGRSEAGEFPGRRSNEEEP